MRVIFANFPLLSKIQTLSHKTVGQTNFLSPPLQLACPKTYLQGLSSDFEQIFLVKNNLVYLLTSVHDTDATDDYNRVIDIALLNAFSCANNKRENQPTDNIISFDFPK